jgi:hypothetical protein
MRQLIVQVDGKHYRGTWDTWSDKAWGQMVEVSYNDGWMIRAPVAGADPERVAERCLEWCVREAHVSNR